LVHSAQNVKDQVKSGRAVREIDREVRLQAKGGEEGLREIRPRLLVVAALQSESRESSPSWSRRARWFSEGIGKTRGRKKY